MKLTGIFIFTLVLIARGFCETTSTVKPPVESTTSSAQTTVTDTTTSQQPDTTTVPPSTTNLPSTTTEPSTTTVVTTSAKPTTTSPPDTTTSTPNPTTPPPATTTKSPEPPTPVEGSWNVTEGNLTCIRADLKIRFKIPVKDHMEYIAVYPNATSSGSCKSSNITQEIEILDSEYSLVMIFEKDSNNAFVKNITFSYTLPEATGAVYNDTRLFSVKLGNSYMCDSSSDVTFGNVTMEVFRIRVQAFGSVGNKDFGIAEECEADNKVNDMVPIAVGIALLVLVVVVLIAYFVGRRKSRQKGYQSV